MSFFGSMASTPLRSCRLSVVPRRATRRIPSTNRAQTLASAKGKIGGESMTIQSKHFPNRSNRTGSLAD